MAVRIVAVRMATNWLFSSISGCRRAGLMVFDSTNSCRPITSPTRLAGRLATTLMMRSANCFVLPRSSSRSMNHTSQTKGKVRHTRTTHTKAKYTTTDPNLKSEIPNPKSQTPNPKSEIPNPKSPPPGFTLFEVMLSLALTTLVMVAVAMAIDVHLRLLDADQSRRGPTRPGAARSHRRRFAQCGRL